jgi:hypothetical protein
MGYVDYESTITVKLNMIIDGKKSGFYAELRNSINLYSDMHVKIDFEREIKSLLTAIKALDTINMITLELIDYKANKHIFGFRYCYKGYDGTEYEMSELDVRNSIYPDYQKADIKQLKKDMKNILQKMQESHTMKLTELIKSNN